jgi:hypothetical protein
MASNARRLVRTSHLLTSSQYIKAMQKEHSPESDMPTQIGCNQRNTGRIQVHTGSGFMACYKNTMK